MRDTYVVVQIGERHEALHIEAQTVAETGELMQAAKNIGGVALETISRDLLHDLSWQAAVNAEQLPTMYDLS